MKPNERDESLEELGRALIARGGGWLFGRLVDERCVRTDHVAAGDTAVVAIEVIGDHPGWTDGDRA